MDEFYQEHFDNCDYCSGIYDSKRSQELKDSLIEKHTEAALDDARSQAEYAYESWKENQA